MFLPEMMYIWSESSWGWPRHIGCSISGFVDGVGDDEVVRGVVASDGGDRDEGGCGDNGPKLGRVLLSEV